MNKFSRFSCASWIKKEGREMKRKFKVQPYQTNAVESVQDAFRYRRIS